MKYAVAKIGQKIIFDRSSSACDRSNTNGNVGTYLLFKLLAETNPDDTFFVISDNDGCFPAGNMVDASKMSEDDLKEAGLDAMFVLTGLTEFEKGSRLFGLLNNLPAKFILMSDDPRCLDSVSSEPRLTRVPDKIVSQFQGQYLFKGQLMQVEYIPIQTASCYGYDIASKEWEDLGRKTIPVIAVANTSGEAYDRVKVLSSLIKHHPKLPVYGRLSQQEKELLGESRCKGEVKYDEMQKILQQSYFTVLVPIRQGWVTSKYIEALMNHVVPIFHEDYATELLACDGLFVVNSPYGLHSILSDHRGRRSRYWVYVCELVNELVKPYVDGKVLSKKLIECVGGK